MTGHHYMECGLENVVIYGLTPETDDAGETVITIPAVDELHRKIAEGIVRRDASMHGAELRFLRTEIGLTQAGLGELVDRDRQTVIHWEKETQRIDRNAEAIIRRHVIECLSLDVDIEIAAIAGMVEHKPIEATIEIEKDGGEYTLAAA
jgi:DNA-binding XRE family transcriptional regulator